MTHSFKEQIEAIQEAMKIVVILNGKDVHSALNDAASTIAALNLTKDLPKPADQSREEYLDKILEFAADYFESPDEEPIGEKILAMSFDRIKELELLSTK
jgi:hypothetical protein